ncbi:MAG: alpha-E domain-containing protein [Bacteroidota bacterium]|nr:alpha-E domain-containing protein [Flavisolibacter sp.]MBD0377183.1 alpha-E domain-containing protein [Flavisolibacter sp.]MDQ3844725.1 alpha-E domain-containing protein [Bacteroidota bacterium]
MLSRIADSLFWMNRYMERADCLLRLLYIHYRLSLDKDVNENKTWRPVLELFVSENGYDLAALENDTYGSLQVLLLDSDNNNSLKVMLNRARENARGVQDHITKEVWEQINQQFHLINHPSVPHQLNDYEALKLIEIFIKHCVMYTGTTEITMSRGTGWDFMNLGKYIERCLQTIVITNKQLEQVSDKGSEVNDILQWRYLLLALSGYELHLKTYRTPDHNYNVLHQVVLNEHFTHSVRYSLQHVDIYLKRVANKQDEESNHLLRCFGRLYSKVQFMEMNILNKCNLQPFLNEVKNDLLVFNQLFNQHFFSYY